MGLLHEIIKESAANIPCSGFRQTLCVSAKSHDQNIVPDPLLFITYTVQSAQCL